MNTPTTSTPALRNVYYFGSAIVLFLITHLTSNRIERLLEWWTANPVVGSIGIRADLIMIYAPLLKLVAFVMAALIILSPALLDGWNNFNVIQWRQVFRSIAVALATILILGLLVFNPGTENMGDQYARLAHSPFTQKDHWFNTRLLMPVLGHVLQLRGEWPYYALSVLLTIIFMTLLQKWNQENEVGLPFWQLVSLSTCSFVIYQFQKGGYPDILVFILFILVMQKNIKQDAKLSLLLLAVIAHESSVFIGIILAWRYLDRDQLVKYVSLVAIYGLIWILVAQMDVADILASHDVNDRSGWEWVLRRPAREILGILVSFKAVWILGVAAIFMAWEKKLHRDLLFVLACLGAGIIMTVMGVDTARMMSFAFPGFLVGLGLLAQYLEPGTKAKLFNAVFALNLLIPSIYIGLVSNVEFTPGLYKIIYEPLIALIAG